jgi:hypothetical protein
MGVQAWSDIRTQRQVAMCLSRTQTECRDLLNRGLADGGFTCNMDPDSRHDSKTIWNATVCMQATYRDWARSRRIRSRIEQWRIISTSNLIRSRIEQCDSDSDSDSNSIDDSGFIMINKKK